VDIITDEFEKIEEAARDGDDRIQEHLRTVRLAELDRRTPGSQQHGRCSVSQSAPIMMLKAGIIGSTPKLITGD